VKSDTLQTACPVELVTPALDDQIADLLLSILPPGRPRRLARMSYAGETKREYDKKAKRFTGQMVPRDKYEDISGPLTRAMLQQHAAGAVTYSYMLDLEGKARAGVFDVDKGGRAVLVAALAAAHELGITAFAIVLPGEQHDGGHVYALYDKLYDAADIRAQVLLVVERAGLETKEVWPGYQQGIRGLFGYHQTKGTRGELLYLDDDGDILTLQLDDPDELAGAVDLVQILATAMANAAPPAVEPKPAPEPRPIRKVTPIKESPGERAAAQITTGRIDTGAIFTEAIKRFNADHPHYISESLVRGEAGNYFCECGNHSSGKPKIAISFHGGIERGRSWSPDCTWFPSGDKNRFIDPFALYVLREHSGNDRAAKEAVARFYGLWQEPRARAYTPPSEPIEYLTLLEIGRRKADAARKRDARQTASATTVADVQARAAEDTTLTPCDRAVLQALIDVAGDRDWCRPSVDRLRKLSSYSTGSTKRALTRLKKRGYITYQDDARQHPHQTTTRTFTCGSYLAPETISDAKDDPQIDHVACEGGRSAPQSESVYDLPAPVDVADDRPEPIDPNALEAVAAVVEPPPSQAPVTGQKPAYTVEHYHTRWLLRCSDGSAHWYGSEAAARAEIPPAGPSAAYDPRHDVSIHGKAVLDLSSWRDPREMRLRETPLDPAGHAQLELPEAEPLIRCAPVEPAAADQYWALRGRAKKKTTSPKQRRYLDGLADALMVWLPASEALAIQAESRLLSRRRTAWGMKVSTEPQQRLNI
jgi:hypothetical protein